MGNLAKKKIENRSGFKLNHGAIRFVKKHQYRILNESVGGDAPKDVIRLYTYGEVKKVKSAKWKKYIAKVGHKWYPAESITEHLITFIGKSFNLNIANSKLIFADGYLRFLSEHFHSEEQSLYHGAEILSSYLNQQDTKMVDTIEAQRKTRDYFHIQDLFDSLIHIFPNDCEKITDGFVNLLLFDALIGNNDRHFYNWGVIYHIQNQHVPYFAPIYDTARALWWNTSEQKIVSLYKENSTNHAAIEKYIFKKSLPKVGIPNVKDANHFELIKHLKSINFINEETKTRFKNVSYLEQAKKTINKEFSALLSKERIWLICYTLDLRFNELQKHI
ncbi:MAG: HipA domain-containing protein [Chitinophagales bacterium]